MALYTYTGKLTDFTGTPFPGAQPRLWVEPDGSGFSGDGVLATKRIPVAVASNGNFSVQLEASATVRPEAIYLLKCEWLDGDTVLGWTDWARFRAPAGGGNIGELNQAPQPPWSIAYGFGPPPPGITGLYIDITGPTAVLYAPEGGRV